MKKSSVVTVFGHGIEAEAARALGISKQAMQKWPTDGEGRITSPVVRQRVLAALAHVFANTALENGTKFRPAITDLLKQ